MNTHVELDALDLTLLELTGNRQDYSRTHQVWTKGHSLHGDSVVMYLTGGDARTIAAHFAALADAIDATTEGVPDDPLTAAADALVASISGGDIPGGAGGEGTPTLAEVSA